MKFSKVDNKRAAVNTVQKTLDVQKTQNVIGVLYQDQKSNKNRKSSEAMSCS